MKILMVCLGNICRSPLAQGILQSKMGDKVIIDSAGTINLHEGEAPDIRSQLVAKKYGVDISMQKSRPIVSTDFYEFDYIFCMDNNNYRDVMKMAPHDATAKVFPILAFAEMSQPSGVPDPYYGGVQGFDDVFQLLEKACYKVIQKIVNQ